MSIAFSDASILFLYVRCSLEKRYCVRETVHQTRYCRFVWHRGTGKCIPERILENCLLTKRCQAVFHNGQHLHLLKVHLAFRLLKDELFELGRAAYNVTCLAWALVKSQRYCVLIKAVEMY